MWACADLLLKRPDGLARTPAVERPDRRLVEGKVDGHRTFMLVADRVDQLTRTALRDLVH